MRSAAAALAIPSANIQTRTAKDDDPRAHWKQQTYLRCTPQDLHFLYRCVLHRGPWLYRTLLLCCVFLFDTWYSLLNSLPSSSFVVHVRFGECGWVACFRWFSFYAIRACYCLCGLDFVTVHQFVSCSHVDAFMFGVDEVLIDRCNRCFVG